MFLEQFRIINETTGRRNKRYLFKCDQCEREFVLVRRKDDREHHFCSNDCRHLSMKEGVLKQKMNAHFMETYGVLNPGQIPAVRAQVEATCFEKYGVSNVSKVESVKKQKVETMLENHGVVNNWCRSDVRERSLRTLEERHGARIPAHCPGILANMRSESARQKRFRSWKLNGTIRISRIEQRFIDALREIFIDVKHQLTVNGWSIDAHVADVDAYVQVDGVYWHGLDRPLSFIEESAKNGSKIDAAIFKKHGVDRVVDDYFRSNGLRLVRITDREIMEAERADDVRGLIEGKLGKRE